MQQPLEIKILITHSDPLISAGLCAVLSRLRDLKVGVCEPGSAVTDFAAANAPAADVVITDYDSGLQLVGLKQVSADRVMILTGRHGERMICDALAQGVRGYLLLGCGPEDLVRGIRSMRQGGVALDPVVVSRIMECERREVLTGREEEVLSQIMLGLSNSAIALKLTMPMTTVKTHVRSILKKLRAVSRTEAAAIAQRRGIMTEGRRFSTFLE